MSEHGLPLPDFDQLSIGVLQHRIRSLDESQLRTLVEHERAHGGRAPVLQLLEARLDQLRQGAEPAPGDPRAAPPVSGTPGGSPVSESTAAPGGTPLRHGVHEQTPGRGRP
ncbi:hypothetical protein [Amycolatopsis taiwanensis]|uniref:DUF8129 domain-containing protein n=1 Tax=Amycolatopsis taiwanensis TaxID=342230 RepID=A0A9W6QWM3_9PSEU|nr:hypothetical protein [Amycolatopsis taiwanensis]GLY64919.1 hypothetical protein Atai01_15380 [Amycolatopsis taiwanensis]